MARSMHLWEHATIINKDSFHYGDWGIIIAYDDGLYYIAMFGDSNDVCEFSRDEFRISRK